ncbi:MAG: thiamine biosynthesis protein ThiS [Nanoarchaeota archaeon]
MKVYVERLDKHVEAKGNDVSGILKSLKLNPVTVLVSKNGKIVLGNEKVSAKDDVIVYSVVSGG